MAFKLQAQLVFAAQDLEELIADKVAESGYVMTDLEWTDDTDATVHVRPMTQEEREEHGLKTPPATADIIAIVNARFEELFEALFSVDMALQDKVATLTETVRNMPQQVVQDVPPTPLSPSVPPRDVSTDALSVGNELNGGHVAATSIKDLLEQNSEMSGTARQSAIDKAKSRQRIQEIRSEQGSLEDAPVVSLVSEDGERFLGPNESYEYPD